MAKDKQGFFGEEHQIEPVSLKSQNPAVKEDLPKKQVGSKPLVGEKKNKMIHLYLTASEKEIFDTYLRNNRRKASELLRELIEKEGIL